MVAIAEKLLSPQQEKVVEVAPLRPVHSIQKVVDAVRKDALDEPARFLAESVSPKGGE